MPTVAETLAAALAHHHAGRPREAASLYRQILAADPANDVACHGLGAALHAQGNLAEAIEFLERAVGLKPESADARFALGVVLAESERFDASVAQLEQALRLAPGSAAIAVALRQAQARQQNRRAIEFYTKGDLDEAEACCRKAVEFAPDEAAPHGNLGNLLKRQGKLDEAATCFRRVLELDDRAAEAHRSLGLIAMEHKQFDEAATQFRRTLELNPRLVETHNQLGAALSEIGRFPEAEISFRRLIELEPGHVEGHNNLGAVMARQRKLDEAAEWFRRALALAPGYAEARYNLGNALKEQNKLTDAVPCFRRAVELQPDHLLARLALGFSLMALGRLNEGWPYYESRWEMPELKDVPRREPRWTGDDLRGRTILVGNEQGFGDTLQFVRYAEMLHKRGGRVVVECAPSLAMLVATCRGVDDVAIVGDHLPAYDVAAPLLSLPGILGTTLETIPARVPYLRPDAKLVAQRRDELGHEGTFKVAIAWQGRPSHTSDAFRSIPLLHFAPIAHTPGVRVYSIQMGHGREQLAGVAQDWPITDLADTLGDFHNTAATLCNLDLVITCDSSPAHLAGALGLRVWVALAFAPDWRWMLDREDSPWYPTMRLFRQTRPDEWADVFARLADELARCVAAREAR